MRRRIPKNKIPDDVRTSCERLGLDPLEQFDPKKVLEAWKRQALAIRPEEELMVTVSINEAKDTILHWLDRSSNRHS